MTGARNASKRPTMTKTPPPPGYEEIQREEMSRLFGRVTAARLLAVPVALGLVIWLAVTKVTPWRRGVLITLGVLAVVLFVHEVLRYRRHGLGRRAFAVNFGFVALGQAAVALATGGLASPVFFIMFPVGLVAAMLVEPPFLFVLVGTQAVAVWAMAWIEIGECLPNFNPMPFGGGALPGWNEAHVLWNAGLATAGLGVMTFLGRSIRRVLDGVLRRALEARHEVLRAHSERARELAALSGEIAHELKNPLASIKGLSALLAEDALPGKPAERLSVLRREVDRMQAILDEFLNFSRPLVPLAIESVDLRSVVEEVAEMHEGTARERDVRLAVVADEQPVRCDPRKIKQAVINLVQNAIEASPAGAAVEIHIDGGRPIRMRVLDLGSGIPDELASKVFEPGVTTKPRGSGLGLTIARALVRQHGGDVTLASRAGGGTVVSMELPAEEGSP
ncbi:MAG: HAMP domain-containing histidine kinase [Deltaproteobacteria bacterium]|nr:HAMP domain-containing histidine kinase [Deltaproteobacteria bacterium]